MRSPQLQQITVYLLAAFLLVALAAPALAEGSGQSQTTNLVGQLYVGDDGGFLLIETQSGEVVILKSEHDLSQFNKSKVRIEGVWSRDSEGATVFQVIAAEEA